MRLQNDILMYLADVFTCVPWRFGDRAQELMGKNDEAGHCYLATGLSSDFSTQILVLAPEEVPQLSTVLQAIRGGKGSPCGKYLQFY